MKRFMLMLAMLLLPIEGEAQGFKGLSVDGTGERVSLTGAPSGRLGGNSESRLF